MLTFLLLTVYHLFIWHYIFKDCIDRNVLNLGYGGNVDIFWLGGGQVIQPGERFSWGDWRGGEHYRSTFTKDPERTIKLVWNSNWPDFFLVYMKISLLLHYRTIIFDYEMILLLVKRTVKYLLKVPLVKPFWKFKEHLFFGYFGVCICETHRQCYHCDVLLKVGLWPYKKNYYFLHWKPFKNDEKCF